MEIREKKRDDRIQEVLIQGKVSWGSGEGLLLCGVYVWRESDIVAMQWV